MVWSVYTTDPDFSFQSSVGRSWTAFVSFLSDSRVVFLPTPAAYPIMWLTFVCIHAGVTEALESIVSDSRYTGTILWS